MGAPKKSAGVKEVFQINRNLLPLKAVLFFLYGGMLSTMPYQPVLMKGIGLSIEEIALIHGILPLTNIPGNGISSLVADAFGCYKPIIVGSAVLFAVSMNLFAYVPAYRVHVEPPYAILDLAPNNNVSTMSIRFCNNDASTNSFQCPALESTLIRNCTCAQSLNSTLSNVTLSLGEPSYSNGTCNYPVLSGDVICSCSRLVLDDVRVEDCVTEEGSHSLTLGLCFTLAICTSIFSNICFVMYDACIFTMTKVYKSDYAKNRIWSILGKGAFPPLAGLLIDLFSKSKDESNFLGAFIMADVCIAISSIITMAMELRIEKPPQSMMGNIVGLIKMVEVDIFFLVIFCMGTIWGFLYNFLFLYLGEMGGTKALMGLTAMVANLAGIPILLFAEILIRKVGQINIILFGALMYTARMFVYSWITNPWWGLLLECLGEVCCLHLVWVAAATYINNIGGEGMRATMQGFIRLTHFSAGRSLGTFVGGLMTSSLGSRTTFRLLGIYIGAAGVLYYILYQCWLKGLSEKRKSSPKNRTEAEDRKLNGGGDELHDLAPSSERSIASVKA